MIYLILAIASSAMVSITMRISETYIKNNMGMFMANYAICLILARIFMGQTSLFAPQFAAADMAIAIGFGLLSGVLYLINFVLLKANMRHNGIVLSSMFMKLGVLVPTLMAILVFHERPELLQVIGVILAVAAIILVNLEKESAQGSMDSQASKKIWLLILLLVSGFTDSMANIYDKTGSAGLKEHYLFYTFLAALILAFVLSVRDKKKISLWDLVFGVLMGIPNYFSARFLLLALGSVPAVITYPVYSVATIVVISVVSVVVFGERISRRKMVAIGLVLVALGMLNG